MKSSKVSIKTRSTPASLSFKGQATKHATVKWSIGVNGSTEFKCDGWRSTSFTDVAEMTSTYRFQTQTKLESAMRLKLFVHHLPLPRSFEP